MSDGVAENGSDVTQGREFQRRPCRLRLRCRRVKSVGLYDADEKYVEGRILDQSVGGLRLETPIWFPEGAKLEVAFNSPNDKQSFLGVVEIRWVKKTGDVFQVGVSSEDMQQF